MLIPDNLLSIAPCPDCGRTYTRQEMAAQLRTTRHFACACGWEYNGIGKGNRRPETIGERIEEMLRTVRGAAGAEKEELQGNGMEP